jgi:hypothetical protein
MFKLTYKAPLPLDSSAETFIPVIILGLLIRQIQAWRAFSSRFDKSLYIFSTKDGPKRLNTR